MADAAFKSAPYPAYTTAQLRDFIARPHFDKYPTAEAAAAMAAEIVRREAVEAGDVSVMTPAERLRHIRATEG